MTEIADPGYGTVTGSGSPVYAFDTDSAQGLGARDRAAVQGREGVPRAAAAFSAAGHDVRDRRRAGRRHLGRPGVDPRRARRARQTPVYGLPRYPVNRYAMPKPKIACSPTARRRPPTRSQIGGGAKSACSGGYCEALFVLTQKMKIPT